MSEPDTFSQFTISNSNHFSNFGQSMDFQQNVEHIVDIHKYHQDPNGENEYYEDSVMDDIVMMTLCLGSSPTSLVVARLVIHDAEVDAI